jgi:uncharacterized lipoprotein YehR (DUF1307 family)
MIEIRGGKIVKKSLRLFALVMCLALVVTALAACSSGSPSSAPNSNSGGSDSQGGSSTANTAPLKFAHICPYTGDFSQYGTLQKNALLIAIEEVNENGGINGRQVEFEYYDDKNVATETVSIANKLIGQEDLLAVIGPFSSTCALAVAQIFAKASVFPAGLLKAGVYLRAGPAGQRLFAALLQKHPRRKPGRTAAWRKPCKMPGTAWPKRRAFTHFPAVVA